MATQKIYNLVRVSTATTGTGTITLGAAVSGFLTFALGGVSDGETVTYAIKDGANSEIGRGVYTASGTTLTRAVLKSTNSDNAISLSGSGEVMITAAAEDFNVIPRGLLRTSVAVNDTLLLQAYDVDGASYTTFGTLTAANTPSFELTQPTIDAAYVKGSWTAAAAWAIPAVTLAGTVTSNGQTFTGTIADLGTVTTVDINGGTIDGSVIGGASAAAITGTVVTGNRFVPNSSTVPTNGLYYPAANTLGWAVNSAAEMQLTSAALSPAVDDGNALGTTALEWADLFLASGGVINWAAGNATLTHSTGLLTSNVAVSLGTSNAFTCGTIELGAASDTTLARSAAGVMTIEGAVVKTAGTETIWIPAGSMKAKSTNGAGTSTYDSGSNDVTFTTFDFDTTTQEYAHSLPIGMPKSWNLGTITAIFYWTNTGGASTETVRWSIAGLSQRDDDALNAAFGSAQTVDDTWLAQNDLHISAATSACTIAGTIAAGSEVIFEFTRVVASDNMAGDARLIGVKILFTTNATNDT